MSKTQSHAAPEDTEGKEGTLKNTRPSRAEILGEETDRGFAFWVVGKDGKGER